MNIVITYIRKYFKVVIAQACAYGVSWALVTYVFLGPLPVVSPAFRQWVKDAPATFKRVVVQAPIYISEMSAALRSRLPGSRTSAGTHTAGDTYIPSPWVLVVPTPVGGSQGTTPYPTHRPTDVVPSIPQPTQAGPFPSGIQRPKSQVTATPVPARPTYPPTATPIPDTPATLSQKEQDTLKEINTRRAAVGAPAVRAISTLSGATRSHADWMNAGSGLSRCGHMGEGGSSPFDRARKAGYRSASGVGEIVACGHPTAKGAVDGWMSSPGHKAIMLDPQYQVVGIAWGRNMSVALFGR